MEIKDSGERRTFETGAIRDIQEGKGRCDLLPIMEVADFLSCDRVLYWIAAIQGAGNDADKVRYAYNSLRMFCEMRGWQESEAMLEAAKQYEQGAKKYGEHNWEKGIPTHSFIDSAVRHYLKCISGYDDEPHDRAFLFNMLGFVWTVNHKPELDDLLYRDQTARWTLCAQNPMTGNGGAGCQVIYCDGGSSTSSETTKRNE